MEITLLGTLDLGTSVGIDVFHRNRSLLPTEIAIPETGALELRPTPVPPVGFQTAFGSGVRIDLHGKQAVADLQRDARERLESQSQRPFDSDLPDDRFLTAGQTESVRALFEASTLTMCHLDLYPVGIGLLEMRFAVQEDAVSPAVFAFLECFERAVYMRFSGTIKRLVAAFLRRCSWPAGAAFMSLTHRFHIDCRDDVEVVAGFAYFAVGGSDHESVLLKACRDKEKGEVERVPFTWGSALVGYVASAVIVGAGVTPTIAAAAVRPWTVIYALNQSWIACKTWQELTRVWLCRELPSSFERWRGLRIDELHDLSRRRLACATVAELANFSLATASIEDLRMMRAFDERGTPNISTMREQIRRQADLFYSVQQDLRGDRLAREERLLTIIAFTFTAISALGVGAAVVGSVLVRPADDDASHWLWHRFGLSLVVSIVSALIVLLLVTAWSWRRRLQRRA